MTVGRKHHTGRPHGASLFLVSAEGRAVQSVLKLFPRKDIAVAMKRVLLASLFLPAVVAVIGWAQNRQPPQPLPALQSPEVNADHRATFRLRAPNAQEVQLAVEGEKPLPMHKDDQGVWSVTTDPLEADFYVYSFVADGVRLIDPSNPLMQPSVFGAESMVHVPGPGSIPWEVNDVPHGILHQHFYKSAVVGDSRDFYVYTPPGYDFRAKRRYPVLCLLHGFGDDAKGWTVTGRANVILDNLIAQGKAVPMIVVMPLGYGVPEILSRDTRGIRDDALRRRNLDGFRQALIREVIPQIENSYRVSKDRDSWAIAGLSMGGGESLMTGLNALDRFAWIGAFSSGGRNGKFETDFPGLDAKANARLHLLWIACGTEDHLIEPNRKFREWLTSKGIRHTDIETLGAHAWTVWRRNLANFVPLLFRKSTN